VAARRGGGVRLYWEVARRGFRRYATYRAATAAGVFTNTIFGFMRAYMFVALFAVQSDVAGYDVSDGLTYTFATQGMTSSFTGCHRIWGGRPTMRSFAASLRL
jgi:ABC-2 type transport system permease protein